MQLGMIGLGRMGANMVRRLEKNGHKCVVYDRSADAVKQLAGEGATGSSSLDDFIKKLQKPRAIWLMVPAAVVDATLHDLVAKLEHISPRHPDRPRLTRMVIDLRCETERRLLPASAGDC